MKGLETSVSCNIIHHGAVNGVTGSCHQLIIDNNNSLLIDCGLFQGAESTSGQNGDSHITDFVENHDEREAQLTVTFDISTVQALLVTHCHIDHVGRIPYLLAAGFTGSIIATEATARLLPMVIEDALKVGITRNRSIINACLKRLKTQLIAVPYKQWHPLLLNSKKGQTHVKVKFQPAGHIIGSAYIEVDVKEGKQKSQRVIFSGDLGATYTPLLPAPKSPYRADVLVIESTYGDKNHQGRKQRTEKLKQVLERAISDNGIVIIPAFSIGRTQELLYELEDIIRQSRKQVSPATLSEIEVIVDSPMAAKFTEHYQYLQNLWDAEAQRKVKQGRQPLDFDNLYTVNSHEEHITTLDYLAKRDKPAIIIAASGMCSGGRVVNYLRRFLSDTTTDVLFVGYQARGTLGRAIQYYSQKENGYVMMDGERVALNAAVTSLSGYSAHADQRNLVNFVKRIRYKPKKVIIVHGDSSAKLALKEKLAGIVDEVVLGR